MSVVGHPFVLIPLTTLYAVSRGEGLRAAVGSTGAVLLATVGPLLVLVIVGVKRAAWSDHDVSDREQRQGFYRAVVVALTVGSGALWVTQPALRKGIVAVWGLILASMLANRFVKSSLHVGFAALCATSVPLPPLGAVAACLAVIAIAWSRLVLQRHTLVEVALGAVIGTAAGLAVRL